MRITTLAAALLSSGLVASPALALEVDKSIEVQAMASQAWQAIGDFCSIAEWHPVIATCELSEKDGATFRTLTTADGATLLEKLLEHDDGAMSYTYEIVESPLPVAGYVSTLSVRTSGYAATIEWRGAFEAKGVADGEAEETIAGIYQAGLDALKAKLK